MKPYLVINYIILEEQEIIVGATDSERWAWDYSRAADTQTIVLVMLYSKTNY